MTTPAGPATAAGKELIHEHGMDIGTMRHISHARMREYVDAIEAEASALPPGCTHHFEGGHFDGDDMVMNEQRGWSLRDRGLGLDGEPLADALPLTVERLARALDVVVGGRDFTNLAASILAALEAERG